MNFINSINNMCYYIINLHNSSTFILNSFKTVCKFVIHIYRYNLWNDPFKNMALISIVTSFNTQHNALKWVTWRFSITLNPIHNKMCVYSYWWLWHLNHLSSLYNLCTTKYILSVTSNYLLIYSNWNIILVISQN